MAEKVGALLGIGAIGVIMLLVVIPAMAVWIAGIEGATGIAPPWEVEWPASSSSASASSVGDALNDAEIDTEAARDHATARHGRVAADILNAIDTESCIVDVFLGSPCPGNYIDPSNGFADGQQGYLVCRNIQDAAHGIVPIRYDAILKTWVAMTAFLGDDSYIDRATERDKCGPWTTLDLTKMALYFVLGDDFYD